MVPARVKCTKEQADQIYTLPSLFMPELATECKEYTPESGKCSVPMWALASVAFVALFFMIFFIFGCYVCVKKLRLCRSQSDIESRNTSFKNQQLSLNGKKNILADNVGNGGQDVDKKLFANGGNHPSDI